MRKISRFLIILSGILWGIMGLFVKKLNYIGLNPIQISSLRWIFSMFIVVCIVFVYDRKKFYIELKYIPITILIGVFSLLSMSTFYFISISLTSIAVSDVLLYISPSWVLVISCLFFKEKITLKKIICVLLIFLGCIFIFALSSNKALNYNLLGIVCGIVASISYAFYGILSSVALKKQDILTLTLYTYIFAAIGSALMLNMKATYSIIENNWGSLIYVLSICIFCTVVPFMLYTIGLKHISPSEASVLCCIEPISATVSSVFIAHEKITLTQIVGITLIIFSIVLLQYKKRSERNE